mgnify:CR=1 FL=1
MPIITGICFGSAGIFVRKLSGNMNNTTIVLRDWLLQYCCLESGLRIRIRSIFKIHFKRLLDFYWSRASWVTWCECMLQFCYQWVVAFACSGAACTFSDCGHDCCIFLFHEAITRRKVLSIFLAICGCVLTSGIFETNESMHWSWIGILVGSVGAIFYAMYSIFSKVGMRRGYPALTITFIVSFQLQ